MSRFLFLLFNALVFLSFVLNDIPFGIRRPLVLLMAIFAIGLSLVGISIVLGRRQQIPKFSMASWQSFLVVLVFVPLVRTPVAVVPIEMKVLLFTGLVALASSQAVAVDDKGNFQSNMFYGTTCFLWLFLLVQGFFGDSDPGSLTKTGLFKSGVSLGFSYSGVFESANHFATLFGFLSMVLFSWLNNLVGRLGVAAISVYVFLALDANIALASFLIVVLFQKGLFFNRWGFVIATLFFPLIFGALSAAVFSLLGLESDVLLSINNRLPMWTGLFSELEDWTPFSYLFGRGWYSNYNDSTLWIYQGIFGQFYSGLKTAHSTSLQIFMDTGCVGLVVWSSLVVKNICRARGGFRGVSQYFGPLAFILLTGVSESLIGVYMPSLLMIVCMFMFLVGTKKLNNREGKID